MSDPDEIRRRFFGIRSCSSFEAETLGGEMDDVLTQFVSASFRWITPSS
jgi:hypothetical protein